MQTVGCTKTFEFGAADDEVAGIKCVLVVLSRRPLLVVDTKERQTGLGYLAAQVVGASIGNADVVLLRRR